MSELDTTRENRDTDPSLGPDRGIVLVGDRPAWVVKVQYALASFLLVAWVSFLVLDVFIPDYEGVPFVAHVIIGAVALFTFPGSEKLLGNFFKRG